MKKYFCNEVIERPRRGSRERNLGSALRFRPQSGTSGECEEWFDRHPENFIANLHAKRGMVSRGEKKGAGATKELSDLLGPIKRYLESSCGRLWDDVYSEIRAVFKNGSMAQEHALGHLLSYVSTNVVRHSDGNLYDYSKFGTARLPVGIRFSNPHFYVDPDTGKLCSINSVEVAEFRRQRWRDRLLTEKIVFIHHPDQKKAYYKEEGGWMEVEYQKPPAICIHERTWLGYSKVQVNGVDMLDVSLIRKTPVTHAVGKRIAQVLGCQRQIPPRGIRPHAAIWLGVDKTWPWVEYALFKVYAKASPKVLWG